MSSSESDCHPNQSDGTGAGLLELRCYKKVLKKAFMKANVLLLRSLKPLDTWTRAGNLHDSTRWEMIKRAAALNEFILEEMRKAEKYNMPTDPATQTAELLMDVDTLRMLWKACGVPKLEEGIVRAPLQITNLASSTKWMRRRVSSAPATSRTG